MTGMARAIIAGLLLAGCQLLAPVPPRVVWTDRVPTPAPEAIAAQPVVGRTQSTLTLLPISPTGAQIGVAYTYEMPHCGINSPIDIDGSFWDAAQALPDPVAFDGVTGSFRLTSADAATFTSDSGAVLRLVRHMGAKEFGFCA
jgi:hypothetical protein